MAPKIVDANVVLRYLLRDDEKLFQKSFALLEDVRTGSQTIIITESVLAECVYVLMKVYGVDRAVISQKMDELFSYRGVSNMDRDDLITALQIFGETNLSIVDCVICSKAINHGMPLVTFDEDLNAVYKKKS